LKLTDLFTSGNKWLFPHLRQPDAMDCGPTCLRIISKHYGRAYSLPFLRQMSYTTREGSSLSQLGAAAEAIGFRSLGAKISFEQMQNEAPLPCIALWNQNHYVVVYRIKNDKVYVSDPALGLVTYQIDEFLEHWIGIGAKTSTKDGIVLLLEPTPEFYNKEDEKRPEKKGFDLLWPYLMPHKSYLVQVFISLLAGSLLSLIFPFLTQGIVDIGIRNRDIHFVYLVLMAMLFIFFGRTAIELIRGWIMLNMSARINISLVSDFFFKLMRLPISYFDTKMNGDILQRIRDNRRIQSFLTGSSLAILFSFLNIIIFGFILLFYNVSIFLVFFGASVIYILWISFFLKRRAVLDYKRFSLEAQNQEKVLELINGMQETKLHNAEQQRRWGWEHMQAKLFKQDIKQLALNQTQSTGAKIINELKSIIITTMTASLVIEGKLTLGEMMSVSYIMGQLNGPIAEIITFMHDFQDAKLSLERISEIHNRDDEEPHDAQVLHDIPDEGDISLNKVSFQYGGPESAWVVRNLSLKIPQGKITAIVGGSGSGKTTLLKLLLKFYPPVRGEIMYNTYNLNKISQHTWRDRCGVVMQEGFIFNDSIAKNIAVGHDEIDQTRLVNAVELANIREFIESLPLAYNTKLGTGGVGVSGGQRQRILIARAIYKDPRIFFMDEATSALDSKNEKIIMENFERWFADRTVVIIAHRLSTVRNAHQIVVMDQGRIAEVGNHDELVALKGAYFTLVKNQLDLDKLDK
jgi:ATP-binding cassette subfamily B protein